MDDLISRQAAIDALIRKTRPHDNGDGTTTICVMSEGLVRKVITDLPTAEKKGKWEKTNWHTEWYGTEEKCSVCGESMLLTDFRNYCPNCGARMEQ